jgi:Fic family protein
VTVRETAGVQVAVDEPESTLLELPVEQLRDAPETVALWLKSLVVSKPKLEAAYASHPRPVVLKRLALIARDAGNERLGEQMDEVVRGAYRHPIGRGHTDRGPRIVVPVHVSSLSTAHQPWLDRQAATFARYVDRIAEQIGDIEPRLPRFAKRVLLDQARVAKAFDAYHSTTIEGYRITPAEVSAVLRGAPVMGHDPIEVRSRMAVVGYSRAFERVLAEVTEADGPVPFTERRIQDLYVELFAPSVEAGVVSADALRGWRTDAAYLRGYVHVPPGPEKLGRLMRQYEDLVNGVSDRPVTRAIMAHLEFVTVHPYPDGNGRLARFLMNLALLGGGLPWVTILSDERPEYFAALHSAQVDGDPGPFVEFIFGYVERAVANTRARWPGRTGAPDRVES